MAKHNNNLPLGTIFSILTFGVAVGFTVGYFSTRQVGPSSQPNITYADIAVLVLTAVAVIVTVLAVFIALLTLVGRNQMLTEVRKIGLEGVRELLGDDHQPSDLVRKVLTERADDFVQSDQFRDMVEDRVTQIAMNPDEDENTWGNEDSEYGDDDGHA